MEELLELHVVIPESGDEDAKTTYRPNTDTTGPGGVDGRFDDLYELVTESGFRVPNRDVPSHDDLGVAVSTQLFEHRTDNMALVEDIRTTVESWYPDATVFKCEYDQTIGEFRSPGDPDTHIVILVSNWGIDRPTVRWERKVETLDAAPLVLDGRLYHADRDGIFALDPESGERLWDHSAPDVVQVPVGRDGLVVGCGGWSVVAVDAESGGERWTSEFDYDEGEIIDSRVALGSNQAYVGLRNGEVRTLALEDGSWSSLYECAATPVQVAAIDTGVVALTTDGELLSLDETGSVMWQTELDRTTSIVTIHDGRVYTRGREAVSSIAVDDGETEWTTDLSGIVGCGRSGKTLVVTTQDRIVGLDVSDGVPTWDYQLPDEGSASGSIAYRDQIVYVNTPQQPIEEGIRSYDRQMLHLIHPVTETELVSFDLGIGDCHGPVAVGDGLVCLVGDRAICLEQFPESTSSG